MSLQEERQIRHTDSTLVPPPGSNSKLAMKMLSPDDLTEVCLKIGAPPSLFPTTESSSSSSFPKPIRYTPRDTPHGLYRSVLHARQAAQWNYYFMSTLHNTCIILQLLLGAALTALGSSASMSGTHGLSITLLAAANTVNAGLIALFHNSGLPNRIKQDCNEWAKVEMVLEEMVFTGLVCEGETKIDAVARCWDLYVSLLSILVCPCVRYGGMKCNGEKKH